MNTNKILLSFFVLFSSFFIIHCDNSDEDNLNDKQSYDIITSGPWIHVNTYVNGVSDFKENTDSCDLDNELHLTIDGVYRSTEGEIICDPPHSGLPQLGNWKFFSRYRIEINNHPINIRVTRKLLILKDNFGNDHFEWWYELK